MQLFVTALRPAPASENISTYCCIELEPGRERAVVFDADLVEGFKPASTGWRSDFRDTRADSDIGISTLFWIERDGDGNPAGKSNDEAPKLDFDRRVMLQFRGSVVTSYAELLAYRELDDSLGLSTMAGEHLADARTGRNGRHALGFAAAVGVWSSRWI